MKNIPIITMIALLAAAWITSSSCTRSESAGYPRCAELEKRFDRVLAAADRTCSADSDCACYGQVTTRSKCGGVTNSKSAAALAAIGKEFHALKCPRYYRCAAWRCVPACYRGACVSDQLKKTMEKNQSRQER